MPLSRRGLLNAGATGAALLGAGPLLSACGAQAGAGIPEQGLPSLSSAAWRPQVGSTLRLALVGAAPVELRLVQVTEHPTPAGSAATGDSYSLTFAGPAGQPLEQAVYALEHDQLGQGALLLVPAATQSADARLYCATVNHSQPR